MDKEQLKKIRENAKQKGHKTVSSYLRELALSKDMKHEIWVSRMLMDIHRKVMQNDRVN